MKCEEVSAEMKNENENGTKLKFVPKKKTLHFLPLHFDLRPAVHNSQYEIK